MVIVYLVDGYNLMHAKGLVPRVRGPLGLHHARERLLNALAATLGAVRSAVTTVVFDAADPPPGAPRESTHKNLHVVYAVSDESADARIEALIASHPSPKRLTVISSDHRLRTAAARRGASSIDADSFWSGKLDHKPRDVARPEPRLANEVGTAETEHWIRVFSILDSDLKQEQSSPGGRDEFAPTDAEIERIAQEVEGEDH